MNIISTLLGGGAGGLVQAVGTVADALHTSTEEEMAAETNQFKAGTDRIRAENELNIAQAEVNKAAARHKSIFVAGARQFIVWGCGCCLFLHWGVLYIANWVMVAFVDPKFVPPEISTLEMTAILGGLLGIHHGARTVEKIKGVATDALVRKGKGILKRK